MGERLPCVCTVHYLANVNIHVHTLPILYPENALGPKYVRSV